MQYKNIQDKIKEIISHDNLTINNRLSAVCEILQNSIDYYDWVGFYFANHEEKTLHLKAFAGEPTNHTVIPFGKGICGQVASLKSKFYSGRCKSTG